MLALALLVFVAMPPTTVWSQGSYPNCGAEIESVIDMTNSDLFGMLIDTRQLALIKPIWFCSARLHQRHGCGCEHLRPVQTRYLQGERGSAFVHCLP